MANSILLSTQQHSIDVNEKTVLFSLEGCTVKVDDKVILAPLSCSVESGDFLTICGPSGVGKSTLLQLLLGFATPTDGQVLFRGRELLPSCLPQLRSEIAVVFQEPVLYENTVREALLSPFQYRNNRALMPSGDRIRSELLAVGLSDLDLDGLVKTLSGGEKQRLSLVRALLLERRILVLDEVTSALDAAHREQVQTLLIERAVTVISVSHDPVWIKRSSQVLTLPLAGKQ